MGLFTSIPHLNGDQTHEQALVIPHLEHRSRPDDTEAHHFLGWQLERQSNRCLPSHSRRVKGQL